MNTDTSFAGSLMGYGPWLELRELEKQGLSFSMAQLDTEGWYVLFGSQEEVPEHLPPGWECAKAQVILVSLDGTEEKEFVLRARRLH